MSIDARSARSIVWPIFLTALTIRWIYALVLFLTSGDRGITGPDSAKYLTTAYEFAAAIQAGSVHGWQWLGPDPAMMPLFIWLMTVNALVVGTHVPLAYVLVQGALDAGTCILVYYLARAIRPYYAAPAMIAAAVNPTQIVMSGMVLPDTPFVIFVALMLYATVRWIQAPAPRWAALIGIGLGAAALVRVLIVPWTAVLLVLLLIVVLISRRVSGQQIRQLGGIAAIVLLFIIPIMARNIILYGAWSLTPQGGVHLAGWIVPLVKEARDRTPWLQTYDAMESLKRERFGPSSTNPFEESRRYNIIGREELGKLGPESIAKAWLFGAAINLASPAIILVPPIMQLPRTGFYATVGHSLFGKVGNFLFRSDNTVYAWILIVGIAGLAVIRFLQFEGAIEIIRQGANWSILLTFSTWLVYILLVNGPVASPKYRLPLEPVLMVLTGAGICALRKRRYNNDESTETHAT